MNVSSFYIFLNIFNIFTILYCRKSENDFQIGCEEASTPVFQHLCHQLQRLHNRRKNNEHPDIPPPICDTTHAHDCAKPGTPIWEEIVGVDQAKLPDQNTIEHAETLQECQDFKCLCNSFYLVECLKSSNNANQKFDCMRRVYNVNFPNSQSCILPNGKYLKKAVRKEYRMLSDEERTRFHNALSRIKQNKIYDNFHAIHYHYSYGGGAHSGPAFLLWHREFIKRFEIALREVDPNVSLPYWDSTMDSLLPEPKDSILWTADFLGSVNDKGNITSGPFKDWITLEVINKSANTDREVYLKSVPLTKLGGKRITRNLGMLGNSLIQEINVTTIINNRDMLYVFGDEFTPNSTCSIRWNQRVGDGMLVEKTLESIHAGVHLYVGGIIGGDMGEFQTSVGDPVFFLLHSFLDHIWELWRQTQQSPSERESSFRQPDQNCHLSDHFIDSIMRPFKYQTVYLKNRDALSNKYTNEFYEYAPRPNCRQNLCGSKYLFCDHANIPNHCVSKIRAGGNCSGFYEDDGPCYNGWCKNNQDNTPCNKCISGTCIVGTNEQTGTTSRNPSTAGQQKDLLQSKGAKVSGLTQKSSQIVNEIRPTPRPYIQRAPNQQGVPGFHSFQTQQQRTTPRPYTQQAQNQRGVQRFNTFQTQQQRKKVYPNSYANANDGNSGLGNSRYASFGNNGFAAVEHIHSGDRTYSYSWGNCDPIKRKLAEQNAIRNADGSYSYTC